MTARWWFAREWSAGELHIMMASLVLAVAMVTGISLFTDRLSLRLVGESNQFLAADVAFDARDVLEADEWLPLITEGTATAETLSFPTMVQAQTGEFALVSAKAVSATYPLRGTLKISERPFGPAIDTQALPGRGEVWLAPRLFPLLNAELGSMITLGNQQFKVSGVIRSEPDSGGSMFDTSPRVLMSFADVSGTGVVAPGSRVAYRLLIAGSEASVSASREALERFYQERVRVRSVTESQPSIAQALDRAERFLLLAGSVGVLLASVAMIMAARRFGERHFAQVAILKSLGATRPAVLGVYTRLILIIGAVALAVGFLIAAALEQAAVWVLSDWVESAVAVAYPIRPFVLGALTLAVCLAVFVLPNVWRLASAPPMRVLRQDLALFGRLKLTDFAFGLTGLIFLTVVYTRSFEMTLSLLMGVLLVAGLGWIAARVVFLGIIPKLPAQGGVWRLAQGNLRRHSLTNGFNTVMFGIAIMLMVILGLVRTSLIDRWQAQLPERAPNHFVLNIQAAEVDQFEQFIRQRSEQVGDFFPMSRARLVAINDQPLAGLEGPERQRESNFSWVDTLPSTNTLVAGTWWQADDVAEVSLDREYAERSNIGLGDWLQYRVGSEVIDLKVTSLREVDWQSLRPNFFVLVEPDSAPELVPSYLSSFYLSPEDKSVLNNLIREFPTITVLEIDVLLAQLKQIIASVSIAVEGVLLLIVGAGLLVLVMGVWGTLLQRRHENAVLKVLGAESSQLARAVRLEFAVLGLLAALLGLCAAEFAVWGIHQSFFESPYEPLVWLWLMVTAGTTAGLSLVGWYSCRQGVVVAPIHALREVGS